MSAAKNKVASYSLTGWSPHRKVSVFPWGGNRSDGAREACRMELYCGLYGLRNHPSLQILYELSVICLHLHGPPPGFKPLYEDAGSRGADLTHTNIRIFNTHRHMLDTPYVYVDLEGVMYEYL